MTKFYILKGKTPVVCCDTMQLAKMFSNGNRFVKHDVINGSSISTIFLGLDHQNGNGPPLLFETMIFEGPFDGDCFRWSTWEEAEAGHELAVKKVRLMNDKLKMACSKLVAKRR